MKELTPDEIREIAAREPEDGPPFQFKEGRYYLGMWNIGVLAALSQFGKGADLTMLAWRLDAEPRKWHVLYRHRHFKEGNDPWDGKDERHWYKVVMPDASEQEVERKIHEMMAGLNAVGGHSEVGFLPIRGDDQAFFAAVEKHKPSWMHMHVQKAE